MDPSWYCQVTRGSSPAAVAAAANFSDLLSLVQFCRGNSVYASGSLQKSNPWCLKISLIFRLCCSVIVQSKQLFAFVCVSHVSAGVSYHYIEITLRLRVFDCLRVSLFRGI